MIHEFLHAIVAKKYLVNGSEYICCKYAEFQNRITAVVRERDAARDALMRAPDADKKRIADLELELARARVPVADWEKLCMPELVEKAKRYYTKYTNAKITYNGRPLPGRHENYAMRLENWCQNGQESPELLDFVKTNKCMVNDVMADRQLTFPRACDFVVMKIKHLISKGYKYDTDKATTDMDEFWRFAYETWLTLTQKEAVDCDDMAILHYVMCRIAGIPAEFLRCAAGVTYGNEGHATFYYLASDGKFRHCNSTSVLDHIDDALGLPGTDSPNPNNMNLKHVWFSWNEDMCWSQFITAGQQQSFVDNRSTSPLLNRLSFETAASVRRPKLSGRDVTDPQLFGKARRKA